MKRKRRGWNRACVIGAPCVLAVVASACVFHHLKQNLRHFENYGILRGAVSVEEPTDAPLVVLVYSDDLGSARVVDDFVLTQPGSFYFALPAGTYRLAAFEDRRGTFTYDPERDRAV